jgi:hypothetical protein
MEMIFCDECFAEVASNMARCPHCGHTIRAAEPVKTAAPAKLSDVPFRASEYIAAAEAAEAANKRKNPLTAVVAVLCLALIGAGLWMFMPGRDAPSDNPAAVTANIDWGGIYIEYLEAQGFAVEEFDFDYGSVLLTHIVDGEVFAIGNISFFDIPGINHPIMLFTETMVEDGELLPYAYEVPHIISEGRVMWELTQQEYDAIVSEDNDGLHTINGKLLASFNLMAQDEDSLNTVLTEIIEWLEVGK